VLRTPPEIDGIGPTRQWIIERVNYGRYDKPTKVVMLDDDLVFATRREDEPTKFRNSTPEDITILFSDIEHYLDNFAHVGVYYREGGNRDTAHTVVNTRLLRILAYRADVLRDRNIRFDRMELMEDFDVTLQLLEQGYPNVKINWIVHNQRSSNAPGGCSTYRTIEKQGEAANRLEQLHPQIRSCRRKTDKNCLEWQSEKDVRISWKNAIDSAPAIAVLDNGTEPGHAQEGPGATEAVE